MCQLSVVLESSLKSLCWNPAFIIKQTVCLILPIPKLFRQYLNKREPTQWCPKSATSLKLLWWDLGTLEITILEKKLLQQSHGLQQCEIWLFSPAATEIRIEFALLWKQVHGNKYFFPSLPCQDLSFSAMSRLAFSHKGHWAEGNLPCPWGWAAGSRLGWGQRGRVLSPAGEDRECWRKPAL